MDMDFMNLHQTAHGGREFGLSARACASNTPSSSALAGTPERNKIDRWIRVAAAVYDSKHLKIARFGDNMLRSPSPKATKFRRKSNSGYSVSGYALGDLVRVTDAISEADVNELLAEYESLYELTPAVKAGGDKRANLKDAARIELGIKNSLKTAAFTLSPQRLKTSMVWRNFRGWPRSAWSQPGYGFGAEGDWKTAALPHVRPKSWRTNCPVEPRSWRITPTTYARQRTRHRRAHARSLPVNRQRKKPARRATPRHWRQSRPGTTDFFGDSRRGAQRYFD